MGTGLLRIYSNACRPLSIGGQDAAAITTQTMKVPYTFNTNPGDAYFGIVTFDDDVTVTDVWIHVAGVTGTARNLVIELRELGATSGIPGTLVTNGTINLTLAGTESLTWVKASFDTPPSVDTTKAYCLVVGAGTGADASNYITMDYYMSGGGSYPTASRGFLSATGFATAGTSSANQVMMAVKAGGLMYGANIYLRTGRSSSSNEAGMRFMLDRPCLLVGFSGMASAQIDQGTWKLYPSGHNPGETTLATWSFGSTFDQMLPTTVKFDKDTWYALAANTEYRFAIDPSSAMTSPYKCAIGTGSDADLLKLFPFEGECYWTEESGGAWSDDTAAIPSLALHLLPIIPDFPDVANVLTSDTVNGVAGTFDEAARNTDPGESDVWYGSGTYKILNATKTPSKRASSIANCEAGNIKSGVTIDDVTGSYAGGGGGGGMPILAGSVVR